MRSGIGRLIDSYAEEVISKAEFEPRLASLRRRVARLETEAMVLQDAAEQARSLQLVIGKLETFAAPVRDRLEDAGWDTKRELIRTLVQRIEIDGQHIRVVFRVAPGPHGGAALPRIGQHCLVLQPDMPISQPLPSAPVGASCALLVSSSPRGPSQRGVGGGWRSEQWRKQAPDLGYGERQQLCRQVHRVLSPRQHPCG